MENININDNGQNEIPQRAVSLYGQSDSADDFPVLKAFQQYIDAEQEKARKRILGLGIFFSAILIVVVAVFMILLHSINVRNQSLSDRLVEYAMKEADRRQQSVSPSVPAQQNDTAMKAMAEALTALKKNIESSNENAEKMRSADKATRDISAQQESLRLQRLQNQLEKEKKMLADERERLRQAEIERQRRKMYPELYEDESGSLKSRSPVRVRTLTDDDIREIIREAYPESSDHGDAKAHPSDGKKPASKKVAEEESEESLEDDAIEYFKDDDYTIPVDVKGADSKVRFRVPVGD